VVDIDPIFMMLPWEKSQKNKTSHFLGASDETNPRVLSQLA
jgi:hypothetical protein